MADPSREVYVFLGDGTYLMMPTEIVTAVQEGVKLIIVSGGQSRLCQYRRPEPVARVSAGFGTRYRQRSKSSGQLDGEISAVDYVANARSLGALATKADTSAELKKRSSRCQNARPHHRHRSRDGSRSARAGLRLLVGRSRRRSFRKRNVCGRRAPVTKKRGARNAITCEKTFTRVDMAVMRVGNAPCSWGTLEFKESAAKQIGYSQMLDELAETGYTGTELGDWGYMPTRSGCAEWRIAEARSGDAGGVCAGGA